MKKVVIINGSPKKRKSVSEKLCMIIRHELFQRAEIEEIYLYETDIDEALLESIHEAQAVVMLQPLYVDCLPSRVLEFMWASQEYESEHEGKRPELYFVINCGFLEFEHNFTAVKIIEKYCSECGFVFGGGVAAGTGGTILNSHSFKRLEELLENMALYICRETALIVNESEKYNMTGRVYFIDEGIPKYLYKARFAKLWSGLAKKNNLSKAKLKEAYYKE